MHAYKEAINHRSLYIDRASREKYAHVHCSKCQATGQLHMKAILPPEIIDKKFLQKGWELDPHVCPSCQEVRRTTRTKARATLHTGTTLDHRGAASVVEPNQAPIPEKEQSTMATNANTLAEQLKPVSATAHKATAKLHRLLGTHFDGEEGRYETGWDDARVASEAGLAPQYVAEVREIAYGTLKEPAELAALRADINSLKELVNETLVNAQREVNALVARADALAKSLGIKSR
jgi:hypothetical protein